MYALTWTLKTRKFLFVLRAAHNVNTRRSFVHRRRRRRHPHKTAAVHIYTRVIRPKWTTATMTTTTNVCFVQWFHRVFRNRHRCNNCTHKSPPIPPVIIISNRHLYRNEQFLTPAAIVNGKTATYTQVRRFTQTVFSSYSTAIMIDLKSKDGRTNDYS